MTNPDDPIAALRLALRDFDEACQKTETDVTQEDADNRVADAGAMLAGVVRVVLNAPLRLIGATTVGEPRAWLEDFDIDVPADEAPHE